jgi:hypothetical protein
MFGGAFEGSYILVHQTGLADPAVSQDNNLGTSVDAFYACAELQYLEKDLLPRRHVVGVRVLCGRGSRWCLLMVVASGAVFAGSWVGASMSQAAEVCDGGP